MPRFRLTPLRAAILTGAYVAAWYGVASALPEQPLVGPIGWGGLYLIGLVWTVFLVERLARRIELRKTPFVPMSRPLISVCGEVPGGRRGGWNPFDPAAWYYGRSSQRLRQSLAMFGAYSLLFVVIYILAHLQFANAGENEFDLPAGGGSESIKASSVKVQKVVRKKYVINPYSSILFAAPPPIDQIVVNLKDETANRYQAGKGDGGLGEGEGDGGGFGGGTGKGKWRFIRLKHSDKYWDKNFGIGGDRNLLAELLAREPKMQGKVADETEAIDIAVLGTFPPRKSPPLVYVGGANSFNPSAAERKILKQFVIEKHGMILGDNLGGSGFHSNFKAVMDEITGVTSVVIPRDDRIHERPFSLPRFPFVVAHGGTAPLGWKVDGRWAVYYHPGALSDAWRDDRAGIKKDVADDCFQLGINILYYAYREYNQWIVSQRP